MFRGIEVMRMIPDRPGRGGTKFGYHSFQQTPINDTRQTLNVHVWQDSWRSDQIGVTGAASFTENVYPDTNDYGGAAVFGTIRALALHGYCKQSNSNPSAGPVTEVLGHNVSDPGVADAKGYIWNYSTYTGYTDYTGGGTVQIIWNLHRICAASSTAPAVFANIGNRCFIATGINECQIYESSAANPYWSNATLYDLGVGAPTAVPAIGALIPGTPGGVGTQTTGYLHVGSKYITQSVPNGDLSVATTAGADTHIMTADGVTWDAGLAFDIYANTSTFSTTGMYVSIPNGSNIATFSGAAIPTDNGWIMLTLTVDGKEFIMEAFGNAPPVESPALGALEARLSTSLKGRLTRDRGDPSALAYWDPEDDIIAQPFAVTGYRWTMRRGGLDIVWAAGVSAVNTVLTQITTTGGNFTWTGTPPSYAYAWYDPITGHISNISPIFAPAPSTETNVGISFSIDVGSISYPPAYTIRLDEFWVDGVQVAPPTSIGRFTHILFFRTVMAGGSTLFPIGSLRPTIPDPVDPTITRDNPEWMGLPNTKMGIYGFPPTASSNKVWIDPSTDSSLLISGALRAPQFTNGKPTYTQDGVSVVLYPSHMAYWDGRLWIAATQDPAALHYSCDRVQCPFGVPEESFPDTNVLRIPASDGAIRGMKLIGENLLITTEKWAYTIAGNNESNYRLMRISTRMAGVGDYQMDEFVSDVEGQAALVVFLGTDSKVYAMPLGGQAVCISKEIQTYLSSPDKALRNTLLASRVHCISIQGRRMVLVYVLGDAPTTRGKTFLYDFDQKIWTEHTFANDDGYTEEGYRMAWASVPSLYENPLEVYAVPTVGTTEHPQVKLRRWLGTAAIPRPVPAGYVETFPLTFDGKKTRKQLHFVRVYVSRHDGDFFDPATGTDYYSWRCNVKVNSEIAGHTASFTDELDDAYKMVGQFCVDTPNQEYGLGAKELIATAAQLTGNDGPLLGYAFDITVTFPTYASHIYRLFAIDIGYSTLSEEQVDI